MEEDFRELVLGKYYKRCKSKQIPVSNLLLSTRLAELQNKGYLKGCELKDLISMCELKPVEKTCLQYIPRDIKPSMGKNEYNSILRELELEHIEPSDEPLECPICLEEYDEEKISIERLSPCGHYAHYSCIFKTSKAMGKDPFCPLCNKKVDNVKPPSYRDLMEGKRQLSEQYNRSLLGESEETKQDQFKRYVLNKTFITQPFINTMLLISSWNYDNPNLQIIPEEYNEYKKLATTTYKDRFNNNFDPDIDELEVKNNKELYELIRENILDKLHYENSMGPLEIQDIWNENSIYHINLMNNVDLYENLNKYRNMAEMKYKVSKRFDDLFRELVDFDDQNNTDIASRIKEKYYTLRAKEDKKGLEPGTLVNKEIFNKNFEKVIKRGCIIM